MGKGGGSFAANGVGDGSFVLLLVESEEIRYGRGDGRGRLIPEMLSRLKGYFGAWRGEGCRWLKIALWGCQSFASKWKCTRQMA